MKKTTTALNVGNHVIKRFTLECEAPSPSLPAPEIAFSIMIYFLDSIPAEEKQAFLDEQELVATEEFLRVAEKNRADAQKTLQEEVEKEEAAKTALENFRTKRARGAEEPGKIEQE